MRAARPFSFHDFIFSVCRYLTWLGIPTKSFNVGQYRRKNCGAVQPHSFFDPNNVEGQTQRTHSAVEALQDMLRWLLYEGGVVAIYDATNSTRERREMIIKPCEENHIQVILIESICQDEALILANIRDVKLSSPDYAGLDPDQAAEDFASRIKHYEQAYETLGPEDSKLTYIKLLNVGSQVVINMIKGYLQSRIVFFLMNMHIRPRTIFFTRVGRSDV